VLDDAEKVATQRIPQLKANIANRHTDLACKVRELAAATLVEQLEAQAMTLASSGDTAILPALGEVAGLIDGAARVAPKPEAARRVSLGGLNFDADVEAPTLPHDRWGNRATSPSSPSQQQQQTSSSPRSAPQLEVTQVSGGDTAARTAGHRSDDDDDHGGAIHTVADDDDNDVPIEDVDDDPRAYGKPSKVRSRTAVSPVPLRKAQHFDGVYSNSLPPAPPPSIPSLSPKAGRKSNKVDPTTFKMNVPNVYGGSDSGSSSGGGGGPPKPKQAW
jgi:hypothetical protein